AAKSRASLGASSGQAALPVIAEVEAGPALDRARAGSGGAHAYEELVDLAAQRLRLLGELAGGAEHLRRRGTGLRGGLGDVAYILRSLAAAGRGLLHVARDLLRRCVLLLDRRRDRGGDRVHLVDRGADAADSLDGHLRLSLDRGDLAADLLGRLGS